MKFYTVSLTTSEISMSGRVGAATGVVLCILSWGVAELRPWHFHDTKFELGRCGDALIGSEPREAGVGKSGVRKVQ